MLKNLRRISAIFVTILLCLNGAVATAKVITLDGKQGKVAVDENLPKRGMHKKQVLKQFGQPSERGDTVGTPPITTWHYPGYSVYFENHHVIHSVKH